MHAFTIRSILSLSLSLSLSLLLVGRVFANGQGDLGSIPGSVIPKTLKMVLDTSLFNNQRYKVRIQGKVDQSRERSSALDCGRQLTIYIYIYIPRLMKQWGFGCICGLW